MEILFYIIPLCVCEAIVYGLSVALDHHLKSKKCKVKKKCLFMVRSNYDKSNTISFVSYCFQLFNCLFVLVYLSIAIIDTFVYRSFLLKNINMYSVVVYSGLSLICVMVISVLSFLSED